MSTTRVPSASVSMVPSVLKVLWFTDHTWGLRIPGRLRTPRPPRSTTSLPWRSCYLPGGLPPWTRDPSPSQPQGLSSAAHSSFNTPLLLGHLASMGSASLTIGNPIAFRPLLLMTDKTPESWDERLNPEYIEGKSPQKEETERKRHQGGCRGQCDLNGVSEGGSK